jgi:hypothetical protein
VIPTVLTTNTPSDDSGLQDSKNSRSASLPRNSTSRVRSNLFPAPVFVITRDSLNMASCDGSELERVPVLRKE